MSIKSLFSILLSILILALPLSGLQAQTADQWVRMSDGLEATSSGPLAIDPLTPSTLYTSSGTRVYKSTNGAQTWLPASNGIENKTIRTLDIDPKNPSTIYAGTWMQGAFKSSNAGQSWAMIGAGQTGTTGFRFVFAPSTVYMGTFEGLYKSNDGGTTWTLTGLTEIDVRNLVIDPVNPNILYAATFMCLGCIYKTTDAGTNWTRINLGLEDQEVESLAIHPSNPSILYVGTWGGGLYKTTDGGASWNYLSLIDNRVSNVSINPHNPNTIYLATIEAGLLRSTDGGKNWSDFNAGLVDPQGALVVVDPINGTNLYATTANGIYKWAGSTPTIHSLFLPLTSKP